MTNITIPRSLLAALVDPAWCRYIDEERLQCSYCRRPINTPRWNEPIQDTANHTDTCPIRQTQELLATTVTCPQCHGAGAVTNALSGVGYAPIIMDFTCPSCRGRGSVAAATGGEQ